MQVQNAFADILKNFGIPNAENLTPVKTGLINSTYTVSCNGKRYIMQKINQSVFKNPQKVIENIVKVTEHLQNKGVSTLVLMPTADRKFYCEFDGMIYRLYEFIENARCFNVATPQTIKNAGRAFGIFQNSLSDFDCGELFETIPDFHNTPVRFKTFEQVLSKDRCLRAKECAAECEYVRSLGADLSKISDGLKNGEIPLRVTHNDTKINNVMINELTGEATVIDLDTVMGGSMLYDFGDAVRTGCATAPEDSKDVPPELDFELYGAFCEGFLPTVKNTITKNEIKLLAYSCFLLTAEQGIRFLSDYLDGDNYFATDYPTHNLLRAKNQIHLCRDIQTKLDRMQQIAEEILSNKF